MRRTVVWLVVMFAMTAGLVPLISLASQVDAGVHNCKPAWKCASPVASNTPVPTATATATPTPTPTVTPTATGCSSLQAQVNAAASGSTLNVANCVYREQVTIGKPLTLVGPATLTAETRSYAFVVQASDVTIDGFTVTGGSAGSQDGPIHVSGVDRFTFRNGRATGSLNGSCIDLNGGSGHQILDSEVDHCAQEGWHVHDFASSVLIARNHNHDNNPDHRYGFGGEAGGGKISRSQATLDGNEVDHNLGPGIWCDPCLAGSVIRKNKVHHNASAGVFVEISDSVTVAGNAAWENSWFAESEWGWAYGAGVLVSSSSHVDVGGNVSAWNQDGITMLSQNRSDSPGNGGNYLHDNTVAMAPQPVASSDEAYTLGFVQDWSGGLFDASKGNHGSGNDYWHSQPEPTSCRFAWNGCISTLAAFNSTPGEEGGLYLTDSQRDAVLSAAGVPLAPEVH
jgi:hypothetical protein